MSNYLLFLAIASNRIRKPNGFSSNWRVQEQILWSSGSNEQELNYL